VPHTHDDVGWLKTPDEYFSGTKYEIQRADVELILESMIRELIRDPTKRFSYVEMKFFSLWWYQQDETLKNTVRQLVQEGRLEFLNAGWSMSDEAAPHFDDFINNM
jgi:lysosomal alpha-mannosidase